MKKDIRSHRDNHFEGMTVRKRVINLGDRSLPISNIASINVVESTPNLLFFVLAVLGAFVVLSTTSDFAALAQTAHRLKGVFAMLNLVPGKQLCETLEHLIREKDVPGIEKYISDIDSYVKSLL